MRVQEQIEMMDCAALVPYARNSRTHSPEQIAQIARSIQEFGFTNPVLIDGQGGIVAGHGRVLAAQSIGVVSVPCLRVDWLTEAQKRAYVIADNKLALNAGWDDALLAAELDDLKHLDFDLSLTGFEGDEIKALLASLDATPEGETDPDDVPAVQAEAVTKPGDVWLLGKHRLMCGDSTDAAMVGRLMNGEKAALLVTSPPYWAKQEYDKTPGIQIVRRFMRDIATAWRDHVRRRIVINTGTTVERGICGEKDGRPAVRICLDAEWVTAMEESGWLLRHRRIWWKSGFLPHTSPEGDMCEQSWEALMTFFRLGHNEGGQERTGENWATEGIWDGIQGVGKNTVGDDHPCPFPVEIPTRFIRLYSKQNDVIAEPFSGSGTTIIAAEQTGRRCYAMELSPQYVDVAVRRWQQYTGKQATRESDGLPFPAAE